MGESNCNIDTIVCAVVEEEVTRKRKITGLNPHSHEARDFRAKNEGGRVVDQWGAPWVRFFLLFFGV